MFQSALFLAEAQTLLSIEPPPSSPHLIASSHDSLHTSAKSQPLLFQSSVPLVHAGVTKKAMVYFSQETKQTWSASPAAQDLAAEHGEIDGGALWLPGNTVLELQMLPMVCLFVTKRMTHLQIRPSETILFCAASVAFALPFFFLPCSLNAVIFSIKTT